MGGWRASEDGCREFTRIQGVKKRVLFVFICHTSLTVKQGTHIDGSGQFENLLLLQHNILLELH